MNIKHILKYLVSLIKEGKLKVNLPNDEHLSKYVKNISTGKKIAVDINYKTEYGDYLIEKYK